MLRSFLKITVVSIILGIFTSSYTEEIKVFAGAGSPYGFGGMKVNYKLMHELDFSLGAGFFNTIYIDQSGNTILPYHIGLTLYPLQSYFDQDIVFNASIYYGVVGLFSHYSYGVFQYDEAIYGYCLAYGFQIRLMSFIGDYIPFDISNLLIDAGIAYLIPGKILSDELEASFRSYDAYIGGGFEF